MQVDRTVAEVIKVRVLLEGVEFPYVASIQVMNSPTSTRCNIAVPSSKFLKAEQIVGAKLHIFWSDSKIRRERPNRDWPLLFQGQLSAESTNKSLDATHTNLTFVGHAKYYDQAKIYFYDPQQKMSVTDTAGANTMAVYMGSTRINIDVAGALSKQSRLRTVLDARSGNMSSDAGRQIAFLSVLLDVLRTSSEFHPFLKYISNQLKLNKRFAAFADPDVRKVLQLQRLQKIVDDRAGALGPNASVMDLLNIVANLMRYDWLHIPDPVLRPTRASTGTQEEAEVRVAQFERATAFTGQLADLIATENRGKVSTIAGVVVVPSPLRVLFIDQADFVNKLLAGADGQIDLATQASRILKKGFAPRSAIASEQSTLSKVAGGAAVFAGSFEEALEKKGGEDKSVDEITEADQLYLEERDELNEFIATPNMEFAQPPACNVVFPTNMSSYGIMRDFDREITRLIAKAQFTAGSERAEEWYIAPQAQSYFLVGADNLKDIDATFADFRRIAPKAFTLKPATGDD